MNEDSAQRRLQLIKTVREEHARNQTALHHREDILYGHHSAYNYGSPAYSPSVLSAEPPATNEGESATVKFPSFRLRFLAAAGIFILFLVMDMNHTHILGLDADTLYSYITEDLSANSIDFISDITYTLDNAFSQKDVQK